MPQRHADLYENGYRYGFQDQEKDNEIKGNGNSLNYTFRMHDPRVGRFFSIDPLTKSYPHYTPYSFSGNKVVAFTELEGKEEFDIKTLSERTGKVILKFQNKANIIAKNNPEKLAQYQSAIDGYNTSMQTFLNNGRLLSAYSLLRYGEGEGGVEFYNLDLLKESSDFEGGYDNAFASIKERASKFLDNRGPSNYVDYKTLQEGYGVVGSDFGTAIGSFGLKFNVGMSKVRMGDEVLVKGTVKFTLADTYRWEKGRSSAYSYLGLGDHDEMVLLKDLGAKNFSIRTHFTSKFTFKDAFWTFNQLSKTDPEKLTNDCDDESYPEISPGKGYSLEPGGEKADYRPQN